MRQGGGSLHLNNDLKLWVTLRELLRFLEGLEFSEKSCLEKIFLKETYLESLGE